MRTLGPVPDLLLSLAEAQEGLLSAEQCERHGIDGARRTRLVRGRRWSSVTRSVFDTIAPPPERRTPDDAPPSPVRPLTVRAGNQLSTWPPTSPGDRLFGHLRRRAAWIGLLAFGSEAVAVGTSAIALHGIDGLPARTRPEAALPAASRRRSRRDVRLRQFDDGMTTASLDDRRTGARRIATAAWALAQAVPELPPANGLAVLDSALRLEAVDRAGLRRAHDHARGRRGVALRHELWDLADPRAASPLESFGRWQCITEGIPPDTLQLPVLSPSGGILGVGDMAWRLPGRRWLVVEMDGHAWHDGDVLLDRRDRDRDNDFASAGHVELLRFDARHVRQEVVGRRVRQHLARLRRTGG